MDRIYAYGAAGSAPSVPASPSSGYPTAGNPGAGTPATKPGPYWYHMIMEELMTIITASGIAPAPGTLNQVKQALDALYMPVSGIGIPSLQGSFKNLALSASGANSNVSISADAIVVKNSVNSYKTAIAVNLVVSGSSSGVANGLDVGALAASTWYSVWVIAKEDGTIAGLLSLSPTDPTLPVGYTFKARVGWIRTDGTANKYPLSFKQLGRQVRYKVASGSNVSALPQMASGTSSAGWTAVGVSAFIPPTASAIDLVMNATITAGFFCAAQNSQFAVGDAPVYATYNGTAGGVNATGRILLESSNIYYWTYSGVTAATKCYGWEDNI